MKRKTNRGSDGHLKAVYLALPLLFFIFATTVVATKPYFINVVENQFFFGTQNITFEEFIHGVDIDGQYPLNFTDTAGSAEVRFDAFNMTNYNSTAALINFTPSNDDVGQWNFLLIVFDSAQEVNATFVHFDVANINDPPYLISYYPLNRTNFTAKENTNNEFNVSVGDVDIPYGDNLTYVWFIDGAVNLTLLNFTNSSANYTPDWMSAGPHNITVNVTDNTSIGFSLTWNMSIANENRAPMTNGTIGNITLVEHGANYSVVNLSNYFYDLDIDDYPLNYSVTDNFNVTFLINQASPNNVTAVSSSHFFGAEVIRFRVWDRYAYNYSNYVTVNVTNINDAPNVTQQANVNRYIGLEVLLQIVAVDYDNDVLAYYDNTTLFNITSAGLINFMPGPGDDGNHTVKITVGDGQVNSTMIFNITILFNTAPVLGKPLTDITFTEDDFIIYPFIILEFNATDVDLEDELNFWSVTNKTSGPANLDIITTDPSAVLATGQISFDPIQEDVGSWSITVYVNDSKGAQDNATFVLNITDIEHPPVLLPDPIPSKRCKIDFVCNLNVSATDADNNLNLFGKNTTMFNLVTAPLGNASTKTGNITFVPDISLIGENWVNITINDSAGLYNWQLVLFNITNNAVPIIEPIPDQPAWEDLLFSYQVDAYDPDPQDTVFYFDNTTLFNISGTGFITFTPNSSQVGNYTINITVSDGMENASAVFNMTIGELNDAPYWDPLLEEYYVNVSTYYSTTEWNSSVLDHTPGNMSVWNSSIYQNNLTLIYMDAYDEETAMLILDMQYLNYTNVSNGTFTSSGIPNFIDFSIYDGHTILLNMTPNNSVIGTYYLNFSIEDSDEGVPTWVDNINWTVIKLIVYNVNDPPIISSSYPAVTWPAYWNMSENTSQEFNVTAYDIDYGDSIRYQWRLNGTNISGANGSSYTYTPDFESSGWRNLSVNITDLFNGSTVRDWMINVSNVNRIGIFGILRHDSYENFSAGVTQTNVSVLLPGSVILDDDGIDYYVSGIFNSAVMDAKEDNYFHVFNNIFWEGNMTPNPSAVTNVTFYTRSSAGINGVCPATLIGAYNVSFFYNSSGSHIYSEAEQCIQYQFLLMTNNTDYTPEIDSVTVTYGIANYTMDQNANRTWIYPSNYFSDPDADDVLSYNMTNSDNTSITTFNYTYDGNRFFLQSSDSSTAGIYPVIIHMSDSYGGNVDSDIVYITITEVQSSEQPQPQPSSGGGGGSSVQRPIEVIVPHDVPMPVSFRLITPRTVTTYENASVEIPLNLLNSGNFTLKGITLEASVTNPDVEVKLSKEYISILEPKKMDFSMLTLSSRRALGDYIVTIKGTSKEPPYEDIVDIFVSSLIKAEGNETAVNTKVAFAADLLSNNPECLELNEFLKKARQLMVEGKNSEAERLMDKIIDSCRYLISPKEKAAADEMPANIYGIPRQSALILFSVVIITLIITIGLVIGWAHMKSKRKEMMKY